MSQGLQIITNASMASNVTSSPIVGDQAYSGYYVVAVYTTSGSLGGTFTLQISGDNVNWQTLPGSSVAISGAGSQSWNVAPGQKYPYLQLVYTAAGGDSGVLNANFFV